MPSEKTGGSVGEASFFDLLDVDHDIVKSCIQFIYCGRWGRALAYSITKTRVKKRV